MKTRALRRGLQLQGSVLRFNAVIKSLLLNNSYIIQHLQAPTFVSFVLQPIRECFECMVGSAEQSAHQNQSRRMLLMLN